MTILTRRERSTAGIGDALLNALPCVPRRLETLKHGWSVVHQTHRVASAYISDNADGNVVEFALNQHLLAPFQSERSNMMRWLQDQKDRSSGSLPRTHQRGDAVDWFRIGFDDPGQAYHFLSEFSRQAKFVYREERWRDPHAEITAPPARGPGAPSAWRPTSVSDASGTNGSRKESDSTSPDAEVEAFEDDGELTEPAADEHPGNLTNAEYALACLPILVDHVMHQVDDVMVTLTYQELAQRLDRRDKHGQPYPRGMGVILGWTMHHVDKAAGELNLDPPYLTTIVVAKSGANKGLPGVGIRERWHGYEELTRAERAARVRLEYARILQFGSRWNDLLMGLGFAPAVATSPPAQDGPPGGPGPGWGGGESAAHKMLKTYVRTHPELFGASSDDWEWRATEEYALRSGDAIDVFFKSDERWVGVEVKSRVSDGNLADLERGLYQVVKYRAVLTAHALIDSPDVVPDIVVMLALEGALPASLRSVATRLGVTVVERVGQRAD